MFREVASGAKTDRAQLRRFGLHIVCARYAIEIQRSLHGDANQVLSAEITKADARFIRAFPRRQCCKSRNTIRERVTGFFTAWVETGHSLINAYGFRGRCIVKLAVVADLAVHSDAAVMLLRDDVVGDRQAEAGALAGRLGGEERPEPACP